jgi:NADH dehydrogenase
LGEAAKFRIVLIEAGSRLLPSFPKKSPKPRVRLQALGVSVIVGGRVSRATEQGLSWPMAS